MHSHADSRHNWIKLPDLFWIVEFQRTRSLISLLNKRNTLSWLIRWIYLKEYGKRNHCKNWNLFRLWVMTEYELTTLMQQAGSCVIIQLSLSETLFLSCIVFCLCCIFNCYWSTNCPTINCPTIDRPTSSDEQARSNFLTSIRRLIPLISLSKLHTRIDHRVLDKITQTIMI